MDDRVYFSAPRAAFEAIAAEIRTDYGPESWLDAAERQVGNLADRRLLDLLEPIAIPTESSTP